MRALLPIAVVFFLGPALSGCVVADVAGAGVSLATTVVTTTAHVAGSVVSGAADAVSGSSDDDKDKDKDKNASHDHDGDDGDK